MKTWTLSANFSDADYDLIRKAAMRGKLSATFFRRADGDVVFKTQTPKKLCRELDDIVDFGATTPADVFGITHLVH